MALWKPFRGNRADLDSIEKHDGYVYFCVDDESLFFDYTDADGVLQRKQISAANAETLCGMSLEELKVAIASQCTVVLAEAQTYTDAALETATTQDAVILAESQSYTDASFAKAKETGEIVTRTELHTTLNIVNGVCYIDAGNITEKGDGING